MKLSFQSNQRDHHGRGRLGALERARSQLTQVVNGVLSGGLEALGERLQGTVRRPTPALLAQMGAAAQAHAHRLREVVERDRALVETSPAERAAAETTLSEAQLDHPFESAPAPVEAPGQEEAPPPAIAAALADVPFIASAARVAPPSPVRCNEPIRTRTMAKLLAKQGHRQRALSIYDFLLAEDPSDSGLAAEAAALRDAE